MTQHQVGSVSGLEEAQARQAVSAQESALAQLVQTRIEARQSLALLLDESTQTASLPERPQWPTVARPVIEPGLPAQVLSRRPDLRAAESRLRKAYATVDTTRTSYYPTLSLTGSVGGSSESLSNVLSNPVGTLGAALVLPFLQWRDMQRNVAISQAEADASVLTFRQTLYQALADVDQALSAQVQLQRQVDAQTERLAQARKVEHISELRYRSGAEPLKTWLDGQESLRQAELAYAEVRYNQLSNWVSLVQALGGGAQATTR
jgi:outer membrane protein TolC